MVDIARRGDRGPLETATERDAGADTSVSGVPVPLGALVFAAHCSANRDERRFDRADSLDVTRDSNPHLAFGLGPHTCVGASLVRREAEPVLTALRFHLPELRLAMRPEELRWRRGLVMRGLESLPTLQAAPSLARRL
jgi:cytochrome P450